MVRRAYAAAVTGRSTSCPRSKCSSTRRGRWNGARLRHETRAHPTSSAKTITGAVTREPEQEQAQDSDGLAEDPRLVAGGRLIGRGAGHERTRPSRRRAAP
ncbi:hypothetical protein GCM10010206_59910 [Streptomyces cinerochromogenes]|nr:hypothetical protein GCM10010206_59910 [Streptomyces cinerochromogenes]